VNRLVKLVAPLAAALAVAACSSNSSSMPPTSAASALMPGVAHVPEWQAKHQAYSPCKELANGVRCFTLLPVHPLACSPSVSCGLIPSELQTRYKLTSLLGKGKGTIVAVIELGDTPTAATDLATYRSTFGLPKANFKKFNQYGQESNYPVSCAQYGFCLEADLDTEMVSTSCPECTIYMIEGGNCGNGVCGLEGAEKEAVTLGATIVSNSWGCHTGVYGPNCGDPNFPSYFSTKNIAYIASSGDDGYGEIEWPATLDNVVAVGGTQIELTGTKPTGEIVWDGAGAGCSTTITKPSWQHDPDCTGRTIADVSAQAGLSPGVAVFDETDYGGWVADVGGTSVATPLTAGIVALAGHEAEYTTGGERFWKLTNKKHKSLFNVISSGSDGDCGNYLCEAGAPKKDSYKTYSGPAGWGTPKGDKAY
jgi:subtilase family serine protease